jgi:hypothetical protein
MKTKNLLLSFLLLLQFSLFAQEDKSERKWEIGIHFSPDYVYRSLKVHKEQEVSSFIVRTRDSLEIADLGFTTGFSFRYKLSQRFHLETGLYHARKGYQSIWIDSLKPLVPDPAIPEKFKTKEQFHYIELPLKAYFIAFQKERFEAFIASAFSAGHLINYNHTVYYQFPDRDENIQFATNYQFKNFNFSYWLSAGFTYFVSKRFRVQFEPFFRKSINSIIDAPIHGRLWSVGLNSGLYFAL